jgi:hypothetical protein
MRAEAGSFEARYPCISRWVREYGWIELGFDWHTGSYARAIEEGGAIRSGGRSTQTVDEWLEALEEGARELMEELGLE